MKLEPVALVGCALAVGLVLWSGFSHIFDVREPWDHAAFGWGYAAALIASGILGALARRLAWLAGLMLIFAMLPIMIVGSGIDPLLGVGIVFLVGLAVPACAIAALSHLLARRSAR